MRRCSACWQCQRILLQILLIAAGLGPVVAASATAYTAIKLIIGAAYLVYLGWRRSGTRHAAARALGELDLRPRHAAHRLRDGFVIKGATNPKTTVFFHRAPCRSSSVDRSAGPGGVRCSCWA